MEKKLIWLFMLIGSILGSFVPLLWGESALSFSSIIFTGIGGISGIWLGYKMSQ